MSTRLLVSESLGNGVRLELHGEPARYLGRVLRARVGDTVYVFNGDDGEWHATIDSIARDGVVLIVGDKRSTHTESPLKVHLVQGISRGERMDFVVQKATELGVKRISPVLTDYGVVKLDARRATTRREHWQRIAGSACEQCGRTRPPLIDAPLALNSWLGHEHDKDSTQVILDPAATEPLAALGTPQTKLCLLIGPEGGFSDRELDDAKLAGFRAVTLGPRVLRTETAALAAISIAQACWGDLG